MGEQFRDAARTYKEFTGMGCDAFRPRWFAWLSSELLEAFALLLKSMERVGAWPTQLSAIVIAFVPKSSGGTLPIGLLAVLVRLWERVRSRLAEISPENVQLGTKRQVPVGCRMEVCLARGGSRARGQE